MVLSARANFVGNDTHNFNPSTSSPDFVTLRQSRGFGAGVFHAALFGDLARNTLPPSSDANGNALRFDNQLLFSDLGLAYDFGETSAAINFTGLLSQSIEGNQKGAQFTATGFNDLRIGAQRRLWSQGAWGSAIAASLNLNQVVDNPFTGDGGGRTLNLEAVIDREIERGVLAMNFGYRWRDHGRSIAQALYEPLPNSSIASVGWSQGFEESAWRWISELSAGVATSSVRGVDAGRLSSEVTSGARWRSAEWTFDGGAGTRVSSGLFTPDWRVYAGAGWTWGTPPGPRPIIEVAAPVTNVSVSNTTTMYKGFQPRDIEALRSVPFDEISQTHEFAMKSTIADADLAGPKPPFEVLRLQNFDFDFASSAILPRHQDLLGRIARYLAAPPAVLKVRVEGHTDSVGAPLRNQQLSQERADAITAFLRAAGVPTTVAIEPVGFGSERPIADNKLDLGRRANRRVEIRILRSIVVAPETRTSAH